MRAYLLSDAEAAHIENLRRCRQESNDLIRMLTIKTAEKDEEERNLTRAVPELVVSKVRRKRSRAKRPALQVVSG